MEVGRVPELTRALGWPGEVVRADLLGIPLLAAVLVDEAEAVRRDAAGEPPAPEPAMFECMFPVGREGIPPVAVSGLVVRARSWRAGASDAAAVGAFAATAVLLASDPGPEAWLDADVSGIGLAVAARSGAVRVLVPPAPYDPPRSTRMQRLVAERLYAAARAPAAG